LAFNVISTNSNSSHLGWWWWVCSHSEFIHKGHKLKYRDSALNDHDMMKSLWDLYDCHVIDFTDEGSNFYDTELIEKSKFYRWLYIISYNRWKSNRPWLYTTTYAISDYRH
jgi:hypothetical protein